MPRNEDEQRRLDEARRKAEEEEAQRLEEEVARRTESLQKLRTQKTGTTQRSGSDDDALVEKAIRQGGKRKLAAIMFTDIKGFSKKMEANEAAAMELLQFHNTTMNYVAVKHSGTIIKSIGDSFMVDFPSAVDAVRCAIEAQETLWKYNQGRSEIDQIQIRIGIHLGDVIAMGKDIFGEGVNIASRIEAITEAGRVCISLDVFNQVKNKMSIKAVSAGSIQLKNISEPIEVFELLIDSIPELAKPSPLVQEALSRKEQEERARKEAEEAERAEAIKKKMEEELQKKEAEMRRRREEEERRKREEEERRKRREEEERLQREEEKRRKEEEETRKQIRQTIKSAKEYLSHNEFEKALEEVQTILAIDPQHAEAIALDEKIRAAQSEYEAEQAKAEEPAPQESTPVEVPVAEEAPPPTIEEPVVAEKPRRRLRIKFPKIPKSAILGAIGVIVAIVVVVVIYQQTRTLFQGKRYVAVLPFVSKSNTDEERTLGAGLAHETAALLSYASNARIMGPSTAFNVTRTTRDPQTLANELKFPYTVVASLSLSGTSATVNIEINDSLGTRIWRGTIGRDRERLMELPGELATTIAGELEIELSDDPKPPTRSADAYAVYLRGRDLLQRERHRTSNAVQLFQQAVTEDRQFAEANSAAAYTLFLTYESGRGTDPQLLTQAEALASRALSFRPSLAEAHAAMGGIAQSRKNYSDALSFLNRALEIMPSNTEALRLLAIVYTIRGEESDALRSIDRAYELDPINHRILTSAGLVNQRFGKSKEAMGYFDQALPLIEDTATYLSTTAGNTLLAAYQYDRAIALYGQRVELDPTNFIDHYKLARAIQLAGKGSQAFEKAISVIEQELQARPQNALASAYLGLALSRYGRYKEGEANVKRAVQSAPNDPVIKYKLADMYSIQKNNAEALKALDEAIRLRYILEEVVDLDLFNINEDPAFIQTISPSL
jgi:class 3 adenylate cyclase/Tfp pilus assembly protein PilF/TolB-like protein